MDNCGKMVLLDKLLPRLQEEGEEGTGGRERREGREGKRTRGGKGRCSLRERGQGAGTDKHLLITEVK